MTSSSNWGTNWGTYDVDHPAAAVHISTGLAVRLGVFSTRAGRYTDFPVEGGGLTYGAHSTDGSFAELVCEHAGAAIRLRLAGSGDDLTGEVEVLRLTEWALRTWFILDVGWTATPDATGSVRVDVPPAERRYVEPPVVVADGPTGGWRMTTDVRPVSVDVYADASHVRSEFEDYGYYFRPPPWESGRSAVLRFTAVTPLVRFAVSRTAHPARLLGPVIVAAEDDPVRDIVGWNTVWDPVNRRRYTVSTRAWVGRKFGGWGVWQIDGFVHAVLAAYAGDHALVADNLEATLGNATGEGRLAALYSGRTRWVDRSHPPIGALATWTVWRTGGVGRSSPLLATAYPLLHRAFWHWFAVRDGNRNGLLEYGSSPVGDGHFVHTKLAAMDESAMDNSPMHDEASFRDDTHSLDVEDVGLNSLLVLEGMLIATFADRLERPPAEAAALRARCAVLAGGVRRDLWDRDREVFANRRWDGNFVRSVTPTSFFPLAAGIATAEQADALVRRWLTEPARFGGEWPVGATTHDDAASADNTYWRGRVWPLLNWLTFLGLRRYGYDEQAGWLADRSGALFDRGWAHRQAWENYGQRSGEGGDSPDADPFYTWSALLPLLRRLGDLGDELAEFDPG